MKPTTSDESFPSLLYNWPQLCKNMMDGLCEGCVFAGAKPLYVPRESHVQQVDYYIVTWRQKDANKCVAVSVGAMI